MGMIAEKNRTRPDVKVNDNRYTYKDSLMWLENPHIMFLTG